MHFGDPIKVHNWSVTELPMRILILFMAQFILWLAMPRFRWKSSAFIFLIFCILAGNYFASGSSKLQIGWLTHDHIYFLLSSMYPDGWLNFLEPKSLSRLISSLSHFNWLFRIATITIECGVIFMLWNRRTVLFFLLGTITLHCLIFSVTGICFYPWVTVEVILAWWVWKKCQFSEIVSGFTKIHFAISVVLIGASVYWLNPSVYVWGDARANYTYHFKVQERNGQLSSLPQYSFWPQFFEFSLRNFHYLYDGKTLPISWGTTNPDLARKLVESKSPEEILTLEEIKGKNRYKPEIAEALQRYLEDILRKNYHPSKLSLWRRIISAPPQRVNFTPPDAFKGDVAEIEKVVIYQMLSYYDGNTYRVIRNIPIMTFELGDN